MISQGLLAQLKKLEPDAEFSGSPKVRSSSGKVYYAKSGSASEKDQYIAETESLNALSEAAPGLTPKVLASGIDDDGRPYFISEYKDLGGLDGSTGKQLAKRLAGEVHQHTSSNGKFGFHVPTFCGATRQPNGWYDTWEECFDALIGNLLEIIGKRGPSYRHLCETGERLKIEVIPKLLGPLDVKPVILHGDLWSGNVGVDADGNPFIFDPSSYFGHNEADLGIARMFGGFPSSFFTTYHEILPKSEPVAQYSQRAQLYELYHHLNHTAIFGGSYAGSAQRLIDQLLAAKL